jgi:hypothetical protein
VKFTTAGADNLVVTYEDEKTNPVVIMEALKKGGVKTTGNPETLK